MRDYHDRGIRPTKICKHQAHQRYGVEEKISVHLLLPIILLTLPGLEEAASPKLARPGEPSMGVTYIFVKHFKSL